MAGIMEEKCELGVLYCKKGGEGEFGGQVRCEVVVTADCGKRS